MKAVLIPLRTGKGSNDIIRKQMEHAIVLIPLRTGKGSNQRMCLTKHSFGLNPFENREGFERWRGITVRTISVLIPLRTGKGSNNTPLVIDGFTVS